MPMGYLRSVVLYVGLAVAPLPLMAADISGNPFVREDASIGVDGRTVRLYGIYVPPTEKACNESTRPLTCGTRASLALEFHIGVEFIHCEEKSRNGDGTINGLCRVRGEDLSAWMLRKGWAVALPDAPFEYQTFEKIARSHGVGIWGLSGEIKRRGRR